MNYHINSLLDPVGEARAWAKTVSPRNGLITVFGLGGGFHLKALLEISSPDAKIITFEPDPEMVKAVPPCPDERTSITSDWVEYKEMFCQSDARYKSVAFATIPAYKQLYKQQYEEFCRGLRREVACLHGDMVTSLRFSYDWQNNVLKNLQHLKDSKPVSRLFGNWKDKPFVILASGPSLDRDFHLLERLKGRAMTCAVGGLLPKLQDFVDFPDFIMAFDGGWANYWGHFRGIQKNSPPLIYDFICQHNVVSGYAGPKVMMSVWPGDYMVNTHVEANIGYLQIGPSIACTMLDLALKVGADPIIFVGQDLAHIRGKAHATDTNLTIKKHEDTPQSTVPARVMGIQGDTLQSNQSLLVFLHTLESMIAKHTNKTFINTSLEGAKIQGTIDKPLERVLEEDCSVDYSSELGELKEKLFEPVPYNMKRFKEHLRLSRIYGERLLRRIDEVEDIQKEFRNTDYAYFYFALQPAWDALKSGRPKSVVKEKAKDAIRFTLPILNETYRKVA